MPPARRGSAALLVEVPFTDVDVPAIERALELWRLLPPCEGSEPPRSDLLFYYNGRCGGRDGANASRSCARVQQLAGRSPARACFGRVLVQGAHLAGAADRYDKLRRSAAWTLGPNNLFYRALAKARRLGYARMLQLEPDVLPIRPRWLERAEIVGALSDAWVIGSALHANCTGEPQTGACVAELPEEFAEHINGNALYAAADDGFARYVAAVRASAIAKLPFDLALHKWRRGHSQPERRRLAHRFEHHSFVLNLGTSPPANVASLREAHPATFLLHSSAFSKMGLDALAALLVGKRNATTTRPTPPTSAQEAPAGGNWVDAAFAAEHSTTATAPPPPLDLAPLAARAGPSRTALVAFVAGTRYDDLCTNFVAHLRRAGVRRYALVALDNESAVRQLVAAGEPVVDASRLVTLQAGGSDEFGSANFFAVNGARYRALLAMLREGFSLFVTDLDVVVLRDPLRWLADDATAPSAPLLMQSDARDGVSQLERDPDLVTRRLGLAAQGWRYANGGTFYCRAGAQSVRLFERVWATLSASRVPPNEQDALNRELAASELPWALLPPTLFPNGFVYWYRPLPAAPPPVLVHANWINGVAEKIYHLREAGLWALPPAGATAAGAERLLSYGDGADSGPDGAASFDVHCAALRDALALAEALGRTLVLPRLPLVRGAPAGALRARSLAHFFDYTRFAAHFPRHREHGAAAEATAAAGAAGVVHVHVDIGRGDSPPAAAGYRVVDVRHAARLEQPVALAQTVDALTPFREARMLHLWTPYRRCGGHGLGVRARRGLQPAGRLAQLARKLHRQLRRKFGPYDCIDATADREFEPRFGAAGDGAGHAAANRSAAALLSAAAARLVLPARRVLVVRHGYPAADVRAAAAEALGSRALWAEEHIAPWYVADYDTPATADTMARAYVEAIVCGKAERVVGSLAAPSTRALCAQRGPQRACDDAFGRPESYLRLET